jgi:hypothetical protein
MQPLRRQAKLTCRFQCLLLLPCRRDPELRTPSSGPSIHGKNTQTPDSHGQCTLLIISIDRLLHLRFDLGPARDCSAPRCTNRVGNCHTPLLDDSHLQRCDANARCTSRILDLHVPRIASHLLDRRHCSRDASRTSGRMCRGRSQHLQPTQHRPDLSAVPSTLSGDGSRHSAKSRRHQRLPLLRSQRCGPVP